MIQVGENRGNLHALQGSNYFIQASQICVFDVGTELGIDAGSSLQYIDIAIDIYNTGRAASAVKKNYECAGNRVFVCGKITILVLEARILYLFFSGRKHMAIHRRRVIAATGYNN